MQEQERQENALLGSGERDRAAGALDFERTQDAESHEGPMLPP
jgi:hypothetical protein